MTALPADAATDQANCPDGYYRRSNGMVMQIPESSQSLAAPVDINLLDTLLDMDREALKTLLQKVLQAGWGYGELKGKDLLEMALKTKGDAYEALKLAALTLAPKAADWREFVALATFWAEREIGKPVGSAPQVNIGAPGSDTIIRVVFVEPKEKVKTIEYKTIDG